MMRLNRFLSWVVNHHWYERLTLLAILAVVYFVIWMVVETLIMGMGGSRGQALLISALFALVIHLLYIRDDRRDKAWRQQFRDMEETYRQSRYR